MKSLEEPEKTTTSLSPPGKDSPEQSRGSKRTDHRRAGGVAVLGGDCKRLFFSEQVSPFSKDSEVMMTEEALTRVSQSVRLRGISPV